MADPFLSEIRMASFGVPPSGWALCDGQLLPINQNQALFSLLGTTFGGDGEVNFALPDFRGRVPIHVGAGHILGERGGAQTHTLTISEMPAHGHLMNASTRDGDTNAPVGNLFAREVGNVYRPASAGLAALSPTIVSNIGGSQAHQNMQPFLTISFMIALVGLFSTPN